MSAYKLIIFALLVLFVQTSLALDSKDILPPEQAFKISVSKSSAEQVELAIEIADGYHLYRDKFKFQSLSDGIQLGEIALPEGKLEHDEVFGDMLVYRNKLTLIVPLIKQANSAQLKLQIKYQGCADIGVCYPTQKQVLEIAFATLDTAESNNAINHFVKGFKSLTPGLFDQELLPPEQAFQFFASVKDDHTLHVSWVAADGYYLYKDKISLSLQSSAQVQLANYSMPVGEGHNDAEYGQVEIYRGETAIDIPLIRAISNAESISLTAKFQGCADRGVCYPPMQSALSLDLPQAVVESKAEFLQPLVAVSEQDSIVYGLKNDGLAMTLLSFFGFGMLLAFTPCIFPMIPILSGIIVGHGRDITTRKAFLLSLSYVLASAVMYTLFGILAALFGSNLQATFQEPWVIAVFSSLFVVLSLSMFDFYHLEMPKSLQALLRHSSDKHRDGSYWGAAIMGFLSSLIVGPCVAAPLAGALIYIGQTGDVVLGGSALFVMGLGMGVPLLLLGASAGKLLPKSGTWLNATKAVFGVLMLGVAVWMLSRILPPAVTMLLSAMLLIIPAIYLSAIDTLPAGASGWRKLWKGLGIMMLVFGILQLIALSAGNYNLLQPLKGVLIGNQAQASQGLRFERVKTVVELDARIKQAITDNKPVMLDFYAEWCVSCKEMEAYTFTDAAVQRQLSNYVLLQADVTENSQDDQALLKRYDLIGPPGIIFFDAGGDERAVSRVIGYKKSEDFVQILQKL